MYGIPDRRRENIQLFWVKFVNVIYKPHNIFLGKTCKHIRDALYSTLQISIGWLSVISSVIPLALKGFYL